MENVSDFFVGIIVFLGVTFVVIPPNVSTPSESGVTSKRRISLTSPPSTPAWTAAPTATTSSGFTVWLGALPSKRSTRAWTAGIRVDPPTKTFWSILTEVNSASFNDVSIGIWQRSIKVEQSSSNFSLVNSFSKCFGPSAPTEINGKLIELCVNVDNSIFAFSAASVSRWRLDYLLLNQCRRCL